MPHQLKVVSLPNAGSKEQKLLCLTSMTQEFDMTTEHTKPWACSGKRARQTKVHTWNKWLALETEPVETSDDENCNTWLIGSFKDIQGEHWRKLSGIQRKKTWFVALKNSVYKEICISDTKDNVKEMSHNLGQPHHEMERKEMVGWEDRCQGPNMKACPKGQS